MIQALVGMGLVVGPIFLLALVWAAGRGARVGADDAGAEAIVVTAFLAGELAQMFLASVTEAELGLLFWVFVGIGAARGTVDTRRKSWPQAVAAGIAPTLGVRTPTGRWIGCE